MVDMRRPFLFLMIWAISTSLFLLKVYYPFPLQRGVQMSIHKAQSSLLDQNVNCKIPDLDPFDQSIRSFINVKGKRHCKGNLSITYEEGLMLRINRTVINGYYKGNFNYCKYQPIFRGPQENDQAITYGPFEKQFSSDVVLKYDFVRVYCYNKLNKEIYTNFHAVIMPKPQVQDECDKNFHLHLRQHQPKESLNVMIFLIDSTSRLNFMRQMPKTRQFLLRDLGAFEMRGYTKVADNTYPNIVPLTLGKFVEELKVDSSLTFDKYNFIWKEFSRNGFITLLAEDTPNIATFNYIKHGFNKPPVDYYYRPFALAMERHDYVWNTGHDCVNDRMEASILLNYVRDFALQNITKPKFSFSFITRLTHDNINLAGMADKPVEQFLKQLKDKGVFENTVLLFLSDHGFRFGGIRNTFVGKAAERLPMFHIAFPKWFLRKYPDMAKNLLLNTKRLSTPFDAYETMKDILYFDGQISKNESFGRGISFFREIPENRTCKDASILPHWCMCFSWQTLSNTSSTTLQAANALLSNINKQLDDHKDKCAQLKLSYVMEATLLTPDDVVISSNTSLNSVTVNRTDHRGIKTDVLTLYQLSIVSKPGAARFEGTLAFNLITHQYSMSGDISRLNLYGNQSKCMNDFHLKKFCFCISKT